MDRSSPASCPSPFRWWICWASLKPSFPMSCSVTRKILFGGCGSLRVCSSVQSCSCFCHRPLSEPRALKVKFDDIFASTRYSKALQDFKKNQQDLVRACACVCVCVCVHACVFHLLSTFRRARFGFTRRSFTTCPSRRRRSTR